MAYGTLFLVKGDWSQAQRNIFKKRSAMPKNHRPWLCWGLLGLCLGSAYCIIWDNSGTGMKIWPKKGFRCSEDLGISLLSVRLPYGCWAGIISNLGDLEEAQTSMEAGPASFPARTRKKVSKGLALVWPRKGIGQKGTTHRTRLRKSTFLQGLTILEDLRIKPYYSLGHHVPGRILPGCGSERKGPGKPEKGRGHVPGDGDGLLAGEDRDLWSLKVNCRLT